MTPKELKLIRLLLGVIIIIVLLFSLFFALAIPSVKMYKKQNSEYRKVKAKYDRISRQHGDALTQLKELKSDNRKIIDAFENGFDEQAFLKYLNSKFQTVKFEKSDPRVEEKFLRYSITVTTSMDTPMKFYEFLTKLNRYSNIIETEFPIEFQAKNGVLEGSFSLKYYYYKVKTAKQTSE